MPNQPMAPPITGPQPPQMSPLENILRSILGYGGATTATGVSAPDLSYNDTGLGERLARYMSGGRDFAQRQFYNDTRAGLLNSATAPENGAPYGGLGFGLADRRAADMTQAQLIEYALRKNIGGQ